MSEKSIDVSVVSVSYQSREELLGLLTSIEQNPSASTIQVHVADNASSDGTEDMLGERFPEVDFVQVGYNSGFSVANNAALRRSAGRYVFLLNPDTRVTGGCVDVLVAFMDANPDVAAAGPKLLTRDLRLQYSIRNLPTLPGFLLEAVFLHHLFPRLLARCGEMVFDESAYESAHPVGWLSGAAMFVRRSALDRVGLLDESFFLYYEEVDWFKRMSDLGLPVWFVPEAAVVHRHDCRGENPDLYPIDVASRRLYWRKHASRPRAAAAMAIAALYIVLRFIGWSVVSLGGSEYAKQQRKAFGRGLRALAPGGAPSRPLPPVAGRERYASAEGD